MFAHPSVRRFWSCPAPKVASVKADITYELQQATDSNLVKGLMAVYTGTGLFADLTGRIAGKTCYYRVRAIKGGLCDSVFTASATGCVVGP